jgi:glycerophosphoryl diester phosphodiesterase
MNLLLDPAARPVIGHRGAAAYAPENTLEGFRRALSLGAEALEFDIRRSADGEAMVFHDATLDRTTDLSGPVAARTREELARADAGYRFLDDDGRHAFRGMGLRIPTLLEVIAAFPEVPLLIEIKEAAVQDAVARILRDQHATGRAVVAGADAAALAAFRVPPFLRGAAQADIARVYFGFGAADPACRCYAVPARYYGLTIPTRRFVRKAHAASSTVHVWTVDDARTALSLWRNGANGMVSNRPDVIRAARSSCTA